jgi:conjugative relaxase-like TrwC/TraI family protein
MLRVTTVFASAAAATAQYYTRYLTRAPGEEPGVWAGQQADTFGLVGRVESAALELLLEGRDPGSGTPLGRPLLDRTTANRRVVRAVAGFDATFSAPKSVSVWWALTGDRGVLEAHDVAVSGALGYLERFGSTTRIRSGGRRLHPDTGGLVMARFRQTTSRADDPQVHTHAVISAKVKTDDGRWWALDARYLKRQQRMLGGVYQSMLRAELTHRYGVEWEPIVNGQAELAGMPRELLQTFSKRSVQIDEALHAKVDDFRERQGRDPTRWERAALCREASADTRAHKTGTGVTELRPRWAREADALGWTPNQVTAELHRAVGEPAPVITMEDVLDDLSAAGSTWSRADVLRAICDHQPTVPGMDGHRWAVALERAADRVIDHCLDLDSGTPSAVRASDSRSVWIEPIAPHLTSEEILVEEERILAWAMDAQAEPAQPSTTVNCGGLDVLQADAAAAVGGEDRLVIVMGAAGTGKTALLREAVRDLDVCGRPVFGLAPTAKAARVLAVAADMDAFTVAKLLHESDRPGGPPPGFRPPAGTTVIVDEAGMVGTSSLARLIDLVDEHAWRLVLVGDPRQLQAVGRGGLFGELCATSRVHELRRVQRFTEAWETDASLRLRAGDPTAIDAYLDHDRVVAGSLDDHVTAVAHEWVCLTAAGRSVAVTASSNDYVDVLNAAIQSTRLALGDLDPTAAVNIAGGEHARRGDVVATRANNRSLVTSNGEPVRNRDRWTVDAVCGDGSLTVSHHAGHGEVTLPADYVRRHVRLGYAATEHGHQGDTVDVALSLVTPATSRRGVYVGATRGRDDNRLHVVTDTADLDEARDVLESVVATDRADVPAVAQRGALEGAVGTRGHRPQAAETSWRLPPWIEKWRLELERARTNAQATLDDWRAARMSATDELAALEPALARARTAWAPFAHRIDQIEHELRETLRPTMWTANHDARNAAFGQRRLAHRHATAATAAVLEAESQIAQIHNAGRTEEHTLGRLEAEASRLQAVAHPGPQGVHLERLYEDHVAQHEGVLAALTTIDRWYRGTRVRSSDLTDAIGMIAMSVGGDAPPLSGLYDITPDNWNDFLAPVIEVLELDHTELLTNLQPVLEPDTIGIDL